MGCNGCGKSQWKRENYDLLPDRCIDQDSVAGGFGDWNSQTNRDRVATLIREKIDEYISERVDFGMESTFSGRPGATLVDRLIAEDYRIEGRYIGTDSPTSTCQGSSFESPCIWDIK